jgi:hypothetical protein
MRSYAKACALLFPLILAGCENALDVDIDNFEPIPQVDDLDFTQVRPAGSPEYWELRFAWGGSNAPSQEIIGSGGSKLRSELDPGTLAALDAVQPSTGFSQGCLPGDCFKFIVAVNGSVTVHNTRAALASFLGEIDSFEEAILLVDAQSFYWDIEGEDTGARATSGGWEFVVLETVKFCAPVQTDRVHLEIRRDGRLFERGRELWERDANSCV